MIYRLSATILLGACVSEGTRAPDAAGDAQAETAGEPCDAEGDHECVSGFESRVCEDGVWVTTQCAEGEACARSTGTCTIGTHSCLGVLMCSIDCPQGDLDCVRTCGEAATVHAVDALGDLNGCQCDKDCWPILCNRLLPLPAYGEISACIAASCGAEAAACAGSGETGSAECPAIRECMLACQGDIFCTEGCFEQGTAEAQTIALFYLACVRRECGPDPAPACLFQAQAGECADLWASCRGITEEEEAP